MCRAYVWVPKVCGTLVTRPLGWAWLIPYKYASASPAKFRLSRSSRVYALLLLSDWDREYDWKWAPTPRSYKQTQPCDKLRCTNANSKSGVQCPYFKKNGDTRRTPKITPVLHRNAVLYNILHCPFHLRCICSSSSSTDVEVQTDNKAYITSVLVFGLDAEVSAARGVRARLPVGITTRLWQQRHALDTGRLRFGWTDEDAEYHQHQQHCHPRVHLLHSTAKQDRLDSIVNVREDCPPYSPPPKKKRR